MFKVKDICSWWGCIMVYPILPIDSFISPRYESGNNSNFLKLLNKEGREYFLEGLGDGNDALLYSALFWILWNQCRWFWADLT